MKYVKQFLIIAAISLAGEALKYLIPLPIPASIYGMVMLFICLLSGIIKLDSVKETGKFLVEIMPVMFIPAAVGLVACGDMIKPILLPIILVVIVPLLTVFFAAGRSSQAVIRKEKGYDE